MFVALQYALFPSNFIYSEVRYLDLVKGTSESRGVYLAIESVSAATRNVDPSVHTLMRRGYWPTLEVMEPDNVTTATPAAYRQVTRRFWEVYYIANETEVNNYLGPTAPPELTGDRKRNA